MIPKRTVGLGLLASVAWMVQAGTGSIQQSARSLPVIADVDVVVVGGSSAAVAAAAEAANQGCSVFLAAPRHYLGEDLCGTYRLWLEPGEEAPAGLAQELFTDDGGEAAFPEGYAFAYAADRPSASVHPDTDPPSRLGDGKWRGAPTQSVQYDDDVRITVDLGGPKVLTSVLLLAFQRPEVFEVYDVTLFSSRDGESWTRVGNAKNERLEEGGFENDPLAISVPVFGLARFLRLDVRKTWRAERMLLAEIIVSGEEDEEPEEGSVPLRPVRPMHVKRTLDRTLLDAGVGFLFGSFPSEVLTDADGRPAGVVIANRSGRQAIIAKCIVDATPRAAVARMAGAEFGGYPSGKQVFERIVVGGQPRTGDGLRLRDRPQFLRIQAPSGREERVWEYEIDIAMPNGGFAAFAEAEQDARDRTFTPESVDASETLFQVPPDPMRGRVRRRGSWPGADLAELRAFQPAGIERLWVLGGCADISREAARAMLRPVEMIPLGERIGRTVAGIAKVTPRPSEVRIEAIPGTPSEPGDVGEVPARMLPRLAQLPPVPSQARVLPVAAEYDVVVIGGGTGGAPAGIAAGREGVRTLVVEFLHGLGGVGTMGLISSYYHGNRVGFTTEVDAGVDQIGRGVKTSQRGWNVRWKSEWYRQAIRKAGADLWYGALGAGALVDEQKVKGVVVATVDGPQLVLADVVIDATGNADIAAAAGALCTYTDASDVAVQGAGLPPRRLAPDYTNTDYTFIDETDVYDIWRVLLAAREKYHGAYDLGQLLDTRERRQIVGDITLTPLDMALGRTHPDTVVISKSNFDTHGYTVHPIFMIRPPDREDVYVNVPYRCLLPRGFDRILVTGLGVSAHRDAIPVIRMQADVQNQGYAAGVAASMVSREDGSTRGLDVKALQRHLVDKGNLPRMVLSAEDSFPLPRAEVERAVAGLANDLEGLEIVLAHADTAMPMLRDSYRSSETEMAKRNYAQVLGMLNDPTGADALIAAVRGRTLDEGWRFTGMGQFGASLSPLDSLVVALGRTRDARGLEPILDILRQLDANSAFSHHRAVAIALETLGDPRAAAPLAELLRQPGVCGHAVTTIDAARTSMPASGTDTTTRNAALTELVLARALYRCGDHEGLGERILREYSRDLHGHYARHATAVLAEGRP